MGETNTVTISIGEYFELRQKAEMHMTMIREIGAFENRMNDFDRRMYELSNVLERHIREGHK